MRRIGIGYFKKVVIVNLIFNEFLIKWLYPIIITDGVSFDVVTTKNALLFLVGSLIYAYIDLSAYADIAIGYGRLFGYKTTENMNYPIFQSNLSDYWSRWHISLSSWCRNNVYFPVLGATRNNNMALYASFIVMGLWHNVSLNWLIWGMWHATGIIIYSKWGRYKRKKKYLKNLLPAPIGYALGMILTCLYAAFGFSFIMLDSHGDMIGSTVRSIRLLLAIFI